VGNRTQFSSGAASPAPVFDSAQWDINDFAVAERMWSVPSPGYDSRNRMPSYIDANNKETFFSYDVESRLTGVTYPSGAETPVSAQSYDVVGKLMSGSTSAGASNLLSQAYGYDLAANRIGAVINSDTFYYNVDNANRLVSEALLSRQRLPMHGRSCRRQRHLAAHGRHLCSQHHQRGPLAPGLLQRKLRRI